MVPVSVEAERIAKLLQDKIGSKADFLFSLVARALITGRVAVTAGQEEVSIGDADPRFLEPINDPQEAEVIFRTITPELTLFGQALFGSALFLGWVKAWGWEKQNNEMLRATAKAMSRLNQDIRSGKRRVTLYDARGRVSERTD